MSERDKEILVAMANGAIAGFSPMTGEEIARRMENPPYRIHDHIGPLVARGLVEEASLADIARMTDLPGASFRKLTPEGWRQSGVRVPPWVTP